MHPRLVEKQVIYDGRRIRLELHHLEKEDGTRLRKEVVAHPGAVVILPMLDLQTVVLIRNYRQAVGQSLIEIPAGTLEKGEPPINCAGRELLEETGYLAGRLTPLGTFYASPGVLGERMHLYVAYDLQQQQQALEADEEIEILPTDFEDVIDMIQSGAICDSKTIAAVLMYERFVRAGDLMRQPDGR